jgi:hypothetical protein
MHHPWSIEGYSYKVDHHSNLKQYPLAPAIPDAKSPKASTKTNFFSHCIERINGKKFKKKLPEFAVAAFVGFGMGAVTLGVIAATGVVTMPLVALACAIAILVAYLFVII